MLKLTADSEKCKGCACVVRVPCFLAGIPDKAIFISESRYEEEEIRRAVSDTIKACPQNAVVLISL